MTTRSPAIICLLHALTRLKASAVCVLWLVSGLLMLPVNASSRLNTYTIDNVASVSYIANASNTLKTLSSNAVHAKVQADTVLPQLEVSKTVKSVQTGFNIYELAYTIKINNIGTVDATGINVIDNLDCSFNMDDVTKPVASWSFLKDNKPVFKNGYLAANAFYTGKMDNQGSCDRALLAISKEELQANPQRLPTQPSLNLTDGKGALKPGQSEVITFSIEVTSNSDSINNVVSNTVFVNTEIAKTPPVPVPNKRPTLVTSKNVKIKRLKSDASVYQLDYTITVANQSTNGANADFLMVIDNLDCTFEMDKPPSERLVKSWSIIKEDATYSRENESSVKPSIKLADGSASPIPINFNHTVVRSVTDSKGRCDDDLWNANDLIPRLGRLNEDGTNPFPIDTDLNLVKDNHYLKPGQQIVIKFSLKADVGTNVKPELLVKERDPKNSVIVGSFFYSSPTNNSSKKRSVQRRAADSAENGVIHQVNIVTNDDGSTTSAAAAAEAPALIVDDLTNKTTGQLFLSKSASKTVAELVDFVDYTLTLVNNTNKDIKGYSITDTLPLGFSYELGSSLVAGKRIANPQGGRGRVLTWSDAETVIPAGQQLVLTYRTQVGVSAMQGDGINRAHASSYDGTLKTLEATARVQVTGGVFSDEGFIIGKVFTDCNGDKLQNQGELGVAGVRVYLEDGTYALSDMEGKYSFYAVKALTHVLKLDNTTLPVGARLIPLSNRNSGAGDSQFVDMKKGELHKADFAIAGQAGTQGNVCANNAVMDEILRRRKTIADKPSAEIDYALKTQLDPRGINPPISGNVLATGVVGQTGASLASPEPPPSFAPVTPNNMSALRPLAAPDKPLAPVAQVLLEEQILKVDNSLDFIDLKDNDTLPIAQANVRVKGMIDSTFRLSVNGIEVNQRRVGKRSKLTDKKLEAWEYIGVELKAGSNSLKLEQLDIGGNVRATKTINLIAPDNLGKIEVDLPAVAMADGNTPVRIKLRLTDNNGVAVTARTQVTLETDKGRWLTDDVNKTEQGTQLFIEGGSAEVMLLPPSNPCDGDISVSTGMIKRDIKIAFLPELRPLVGNGILEGILDMRRLGNGSLTNARPKDAFEKELTNFASSSDNGKVRGSARAAFFFKGSIQGKYLLTTAYDSDKSTSERLFRDIRPDQYYPIYGDSATKGFDAQSSNRLYVRVDKDKSYLLYGDYTTASNTDVRQITQYNRSLTGVKGHYEDERFNVTGFYSRNSSVQVIEELPANGTSGPYTLAQINNNYLENSERVEVIVRDRNQSGVILSSAVQTRFIDYNIDPLSKRLLFRGPVASMDERLNPQYIRVTYETSGNGVGGMGGGPQFGIAGVDAQVKLTDRVQLGVIGVQDDNPTNKATMGGVTTAIKLGEKTLLNGEFAHTQTDLKGSGNAERLELRHDNGDLKARVQFTNTEARFSNPSSFGSIGRTEIPASAEYRLNANTKLKAEAIYSKDNVNGGDRKGIVGNVVSHIADGVDLEMGMRASITNSSIGSSSCVSYLSSMTGSCMPVAGVSAIGQHIRNELLTVRSKITTQVPWVTAMQAYLEAEQDVRDSQKRLLALGTNYQLSEKTRLYARYQLASTLGSQFNLNSFAPNNLWLIGIESAYMKGGNLYNEFRLRDGQSGREASTALGLRNTWLIDEGLRLGAGFETTKMFNGIAGNDSNALVGTMEYFKNPRYRTTASLELRKSDMSDSLLNTLALSYKIDEDWSFLGRNYFSIMDNQGAGIVLQTRQQLGFAYRQVQTNVWNFLGRYEHKYESGALGSGITGSGVQGSTGSLSTISTATDTHIVSAHLNYQASADVILSSRYAAKVATNNYLNPSSVYWAQLLYGRATWDFLPKWDMSVQAGGYLGKGGAMQYALGAELGYQVIENLWLSVGYNVSGVTDADLTSNTYLDSGVYIRGRFKFDENSLAFLQ